LLLQVTKLPTHLFMILLVYGRQRLIEEALGTYDGLIKTYSNPFSPDRHEALGPDDYEMTVWRGPRLELIG